MYLYRLWKAKDHNISIQSYPSACQRIYLYTPQSTVYADIISSACSDTLLQTVNPGSLEIRASQYISTTWLLRTL